MAAIHLGGKVARNNFAVYGTNLKPNRGLLDGAGADGPVGTPGFLGVTSLLADPAMTLLRHQRKTSLSQHR